MQCNSLLFLLWLGLFFILCYRTRGHIDMKLNSLLSIWVSKK